MTSLQKLHITIKILGNAYAQIPVQIVSRMLKMEDEAIISGIDRLIALGLVKYTDGERDKIELTPKGKLAKVM
jgi:Mn-dependent DtxR family transcriptional regulator